jgi:hypothetical protein
MAETDTLSFNGVGFIESQERVDEYKSPVPAKGPRATLFTAPIKRTAKVGAVNTGSEDCVLRMKHQGTVKTVTNALLTGLAQGSNKYIGALQFGSIVPKSVSITNAGAPLTIVDDGAGNLYDAGFVGVAANFRGTINYVTGAITFQYGAPPTEPVRITFQHTDAVDFASAAQAITGTPVLNTPFSLAFGRVVPGSVTFTDGTNTWVDDGLGNMIETAPAYAKVGTIDYATGVVTLTSGPTPGAITSGSFTFNPFATLLRAAGSAKLLDLFSQIPEMTDVPYGLGIRNENALVMTGEGRGNKGTNIHTMWSHYSEEPYRVTAVFAGFPPGGHDNDPTLSQAVNHL